MFTFLNVKNRNGTEKNEKKTQTLRGLSLSPKKCLIKKKAQKPKKKPKKPKKPHKK
jgi:hypothetical protein